MADQTTKKQKGRTAEILSVLARHNFYSAGFTPEELRTTLEDLGPFYVKLGQILSSRTDILPDSYCKELEKLRSNVRPLPASDARRVIEEETGKKIEDIYSEFRDEPLGSASIAQAHFGILKDGTKVVTKVQRPGVADMVRKDFALLKKLASVANIVQEGDDGESVDLLSILEELEKVSEEELDFRVEAQHTRDFREKCIEDDNVITCPKIIDELTTERILTMTFVDGYSIAKKEKVDADGYERLPIARAIIGNYLHQVLDVGISHGDPHQGNIMITHGVPCWIDFGMIGTINESQIACMEKLITSLVQKDVQGVTDAALSIGKAPANLDKSAFSEDVEAMIMPLLSTGSLKNLDIGGIMTDMTNIMNNYHIRMPSDYTMLVRSLVTIEGVLEEFCPELDIFDELSRKMMERAQARFNMDQVIEEMTAKVTSSAAQTVRLVKSVLDILKALSMGKLKVNIALTGYENAVSDLKRLVINIILAIFACVLFSGSCTLATTNMVPQAYGVPVLALAGFVISISLAIVTIHRLTGNK